MIGKLDRERRTNGAKYRHLGPHLYINPFYFIVILIYFNLFSSLILPWAFLLLLLLLDPAQSRQCYFASLAPLDMPEVLMSKKPSANQLHMCLHAGPS